jgi:hypothetical protein
MMPFEERWENIHILSNEPVFQRVDEKHRLDFYLGRDVQGERLLLLLIDSEPPAFRQCHAININSTKRHDGRWALVLKLMRPELGKIFSHLCEDLVEASRNIDDVAGGASYVLARFERWQRLLERGHSGLLDETELRGLIAELIFMERFAIPRYGVIQSVRSWFGPLGADQDFRFHDRWYEVKSIRPGASHVVISSVEQLEGEGNSGELAIVCLDRSGNNEPGSFSPISLVRRLKEILQNEPVACGEFEDKLIAAGFIECPEYESYHFSVSNIRRFAVSEGFPRICRSDIHSGIINATYQLEISSLVPFEIF